MSTAVLTISTDATVRDAAKLMLARSVSALPVADPEGRLLGMVSEGDLVRRTELGTDAPRSWWLQPFAEDVARDYLKMHGTTVRDVMTSPVISVRPVTPLQEVARLLEKHRIKRVPVLRSGRMVGIVSRADLVRRLATLPGRPGGRSSGDRALRRKVLQNLQRPGIDLAYTNVTVDGGVVHFWGGLRSRSDQRVLRVAAEAVEGVRKVEDHTDVIPQRVAAALGSL